MALEALIPKTHLAGVGIEMNHAEGNLALKTILIRSNSRLTPVFNYEGHGLGSANREAFINESVSVSAASEPSTWLLMFAGIGGIGLMLR